MLHVQACHRAVPRWSFAGFCVHLVLPLPITQVDVVCGLLRHAALPASGQAAGTNQGHSRAVHARGWSPCHCCYQVPKWWCRNLPICVISHLVVAPWSTSGPHRRHQQHEHPKRQPAAAMQDSTAVQGMPRNDVHPSPSAAVPRWRGVRPTAASGAPHASFASGSEPLSSKMWNSSFRSVVSHLGVPHTILEDMREDVRDGDDASALAPSRRGDSGAMADRSAALAHRDGA